ncbi:hypothetical protein FB567DRAFT_587943 [Paraphoma chrysanthemicola]|uniref:Uncharacterized protein n=1 Tax=Paraphoma chrysanthemicola TaxID=798071 RepID=A0A8K0W2V2_9PLEO|nr:hypothetical protein FB567DRAFT_587943 [Paraphoma chrysanthemicola]
MASIIQLITSALPKFLLLTYSKEITVAWVDLPDYLATFENNTAPASRPPTRLKIDMTCKIYPYKKPATIRPVDILPLIRLRERFPRMSIECFRHPHPESAVVDQYDCEEIMRLISLETPSWLHFIRNSLDRIEVHRMVRYCGYVNFVLKPGHEPEGFVEASKKEGVHMASFSCLRDMGLLKTPADWSDMFLIVAKEMEEKR